MKHIYIFLLTCLTTFASAQVTTYNVGDTVEDFTIVDTHGVEHNLYSITATGKYVFLDFFFRNCGPCQATSQYFYQLYETYGENQGHIYAMSISPIDNNATIQIFEDLYSGGFAAPPAAGTEGNGPAVVSQFGIGAFPTYCIIAPDNTLAVGDIWPIQNMSTFEGAFPPGLVNLLSVNDMNSQNSFAVYPTVSNGNFNVSLSKDASSVISVFDMSGKKVFTGSYGSKEISMSLKLASGIYIINVTTEGKTNSKKLIIKN